MVDIHKPIAWYIPDEDGGVYQATGNDRQVQQWAKQGKKILPLYGKTHIDRILKERDMMADPIPFAGYI
jgi:hypothetical protein